MLKRDHPLYPDYEAALAARDEAQKQLDDLAGSYEEPDARRALSRAQHTLNKFAVEIGHT